MILILMYNIVSLCVCCSWLSMLENTKWLSHISGLMRAGMIVVNAIDKEARSVLVHCSDGWDRTPQIVALAEIMLDPYYRTIEVGTQKYTQFYKCMHQGVIFKWPCHPQHVVPSGEIM